MKLRALGMSKRFLVAAPSYLNKTTRPDAPAEISTHRAIRMSNVIGSEVLELITHEGDHHVVPLRGNFRVDHGLAVRQALVAGCGIAPAHQWLVDDLLKSGALEILLPECTLPPVPLSMLIVPERAIVSRVRLLIEYLAERIAAIPGIE